MTQTRALKGRSMTTGTVHYARTVRHIDRTVKVPMLAQICGMSRRAIAYLDAVPDDTEVTCKRCLASLAMRGTR